MLGIMQARGLQNVTTADGLTAYISSRLTTSVKDPVAFLRWCAQNKRLDVLSPRVVSSQLVDEEGRLALRPDGVEIQELFRVTIRGGKS